MMKHILTPAGLIIGVGLDAGRYFRHCCGSAATREGASAGSACSAKHHSRPRNRRSCLQTTDDIVGRARYFRYVADQPSGHEPPARTAKLGDDSTLPMRSSRRRRRAAEASQKQSASGTLPSSESGAAIRQTSLIVDPPNGQFPPLTDYGKQLQSKMNSTYKPGKDAEGSYDGIEDFGPWDRCITRGLPVSMEPRNYNNGIRITQSPGFVIITVEMAHEARVIPTTPMPKLDPAIKNWLGESRGHWEGNTLVIETTNFNGQTELTSAGVPGSPGPLQPSSTSMTTVERITRTGPDTGEYSIKVIDPTVLATGSFTVAYPMMLDNSYQMFEYACHEGNTAVRNYIETARYAKAHPKPPAPAGAAPAGGRGGGRGGAAAPTTPAAPRASR